MSKKTWLKLKRGLIKDPKHRQAMGECVWLYLYILDRADFETGIVSDWKDVAEAEEMELPVRTLRYQREKLETAGYIAMKKGQHAQQITILRWQNPRIGETGKELPLSDVVQSSNPLPVSELETGNQSGNPLPLAEIQSGNQSGNQTGNQSGNPLPLASCNSHMAMLPYSHVARHEPPAPDPEPEKLETELPEDFPITQPMRAWAAGKLNAAGVDLDVDLDTEKFCDHARTKGRTARDWQAAWRAWIRESIERKQRGVNGVKNNGGNAKPESNRRADSQPAKTGASETVIGAQDFRAKTQIGKRPGEA